MSKKALMKELSAKFEGYRILGFNESGTRILMLNSDFTPCTYEVRDEDHGVVIPERITPVSLSATYAFNETEKVEVDCGDLLSNMLQEACDKAEVSARECEAAQQDLENCKTQLAAMAERENARRMTACEDAVKARLEDAVKHLCADRSLADDVLADVKAGKYMNSVDADGNWVGDALAVNALLAKVGEAQMKAAQQPSRYAWEGGLVKNSGAGDSLADAIAHISD